MARLISVHCAIAIKQFCNDTLPEGVLTPITAKIEHSIQGEYGIKRIGNPDLHLGSLWESHADRKVCV